MSRSRTRLVVFLLLLWGPVASAQERIPVDVTIDTKPARFALDTGASHTILFKPGALDIGEDAKRQPLHLFGSQRLHVQVDEIAMNSN